MGKIDDFEQKLIKEGMTDEDLIEYEKLLKRVRGNFLKRQHCYTTAIQFPHQYAEQAVKLIQYGLENFEDDWFSTYTSYLYIGHIYERIRNYQKSFNAYLMAKDALGLEHLEYVKELSKDLMWMKLHVDSFKYAIELEEYFSNYKKTDDFSKSFVNTEFKVTIVNIVISMHYGRLDDAKKFLEKAKGMCKPNYAGKLYGILARHKYYEALNTTPEALAFVSQLKI
jgi:tetratricopeptide (TPR) repeat protein